MNAIVVGVDGSESSLAALDFAAEEAACREARPVVVTAWEIPPNALLVAGAVPGFLDRIREDAEQLAREAGARAKKLRPDISCETKVIQNHPGRALLEEAQGAILIVAGSRGRGGFASLVLGSISQEIVLHAPCSVVVRPRLAPDTDQEAAKEEAA